MISPDRRKGAGVKYHVAAVKAEMSKSELLHPDVLNWMPDEKKHLYVERYVPIRGGISIPTILERMDTRKLFSARRNGIKYDSSKRMKALEEDASTPFVPSTSSKVTYGVSRDQEVLPTWRVTLVGRRNVGLTPVSGTSVPIGELEYNSIMAEGIVVKSGFIAAQGSKLRRAKDCVVLDSKLSVGAHSSEKYAGLLGVHKPETRKRKVRDEDCILGESTADAVDDDIY